MRCVVIGSGAFGFAIAVNLLKNGNDVTVWCSSKDKLNEIQSGKEIIPGIKIPTEMKFTDNIKDAVIDADVIYLMTSAKYIGDVTKKLINMLKKMQYTVLVVKELNKEVVNLFMKYLRRTLIIAIMQLYQAQALQ